MPRKTLPIRIELRLLYVAVAPIMIAAVNPGREQDGQSPRTVMKVYAEHDKAHGTGRLKGDLQAAQSDC